MVKKRGLNRGLEALLQGSGSLDVDLTQDQPSGKRWLARIAGGVDSTWGLSAPQRHRTRGVR